MSRVIRFLPSMPEAEPAPEPQRDDSALLAAISENTALLREVLAELRTKKHFTFTVAKDATGRLSHIDADQK